MTRLGIIGAGNFSYTHKSAVKLLPDCEICAISDLVIEKAEALAEGTDAKVYTDYKEMLAKEKPDGVILNLPHFLHKSVTIDCLEMGVPVLVEKPMALNSEECDEMIAASKRTGVPFAVGHLSAYSKSCKELKKIIQNKTLGELVAINEIRTANYFVNRPAWFLDKKLSGGGIMMNLGAHYIDKVLYLTDSEPEVLSSVFSNKATNDNVEATAQFLLRLPENVSASGTFSGCAGSGQCETTLYFSRGAAQIRYGLELWISKEGGTYEPVVTGDHSEIMNQTMVEQIEEFSKLIRGEENHATTPEHGGRVISVLETILSE